MVYLRLITPALARLLDAAASEPEIKQPRYDFIEERLRALVQTQSPSLLEDALWIYLVSQHQLLSRAVHDSQVPAQPQGTNCGALTTPTSSGNSCGSLPPLLLLPESLACISDAVRWYCGELPTHATSPHCDECEAASRTTLQPSPGAQQRTRPKPKATSHIKHEFHAFEAEKPGERLDELLRHRQQPTPSPAPTHATQRPKHATGLLATVQLALDAFAQHKRIFALLQPCTIALLVRDLVSLWSLIYLCKRLRLHQQRKDRLLTGTATAASEAMYAKRGLGGDLRRRGSTRAGHIAGLRLTDADPISVCFHDYDLLLPWDLVRRVLSSPDLCMAAVAEQCRVLETSRFHAPSSASARAGPTSSSPAFALIINPAVTAMDDNPDRLSKNARIDAIDKAASKYYYTLLSARAHGQTSEHTWCAPPGASPASAAAHQEALRSSLTTVDIGEYGVLDPSRMRTPSCLAGAERSLLGGAGDGSTRVVSASPEAVAKSYALFLRDASIGFDIQVMALTGAGVGYYLGYLRGLSSEWCTLYAVVGLVTMMLVDAGLLLIRVRRQDEAVLRARKRVRQKREKLHREGEQLVQSMQAAACLLAADGAAFPSPSASKASTEKSKAVVEAAEVSLQTETDPHTKKNQ